MNPLISAGVLLIHIAFDSYIVILLLRLMLQKLQANWYNPVSQFLVQLTEKPLKPLRRFIPGFHGYDLSIVAFAVILQIIEIFLLVLLQFSAFPHLLGLLIATIGELLSKCVYIYIYAIIINAIASWIPPMQGQPATQIVYLITEPLLFYARRIIPVVAGIDLSPMIVLVVLTLINLLIVGPILTMGAGIILG
jgi:YggT family protein